jgi:hypothetical protein
VTIETIDYGFDADGVVTMWGASPFLNSTQTSAPVAIASTSVTAASTAVQCVRYLVAPSARSENEWISPDRSSMCPPNTVVLCREVRVSESR